MSSLPKRKGSFPIAAKWGAKLAVIFLGPFCLRSFSRKVFYHSVPSCRPLGIEVELELPCHVCCWAVNDLLAVFGFWDGRCWYSHWMMLMTWLMGVFFSWAFLRPNSARDLEIPSYWWFRNPRMTTETQCLQIDIPGACLWDHVCVCGCICKLHSPKPPLKALQFFARQARRGGHLTLVQFVKLNDGMNQTKACIFPCKLHLEI